MGTGLDNKMVYCQEFKLSRYMQGVMVKQPFRAITQKFTCNAMWDRGLAAMQGNSSSNSHVTPCGTGV